MFVGEKLMVFSFTVNSHSRGKYLLVFDIFSIQFGTKSIQNSEGSAYSSKPRQCSLTVL